MGSSASCFSANQVEPKPTDIESTKQSVNKAQEQKKETKEVNKANNQGTKVGSSTGKSYAERKIHQIKAKAPKKTVRSGRIEAISESQPDLPKMERINTFSPTMQTTKTSSSGMSIGSSYVTKEHKMETITPNDMISPSEGDLESKDSFQFPGFNPQLSSTFTGSSRQSSASINVTSPQMVSQVSSSKNNTNQQTPYSSKHINNLTPFGQPTRQHSNKNLSNTPEKAKKKPKEVQRKRQIGGGVTGKIYDGMFGDKECVIKSINKKNSRSRGLFSREYKSLSIIKHDNIVKLYGRSRDTDNYYLILEKGAIDLADYRMQYTMPETQVKNVIKKLLEAIDHMHKFGFCHRDIKPENIVFRKGNDNNPVLIDFGETLNTKSQQLHRNDLVGTPNYLSKERLLFDELSAEQFEKADIFAIGVVCYELITGVHCFAGNTNEDTYKMVIANKWKWTSNMPYQPSKNCLEFVNKALCPNYLNRPSVKQLLQMPWFYQQC